MGMKFLVGFFLGTAFGATTAVLMAPSSGRRLRAALSKEAKKLAVHASALVPDEWNRISDEDNTKEILENFESLRSAGF